jgi:hypothetical protein
MKQHNQRCIGHVIEPVDINKIAIVEFPALATVNDDRPFEKVGINRLGMPAAEPDRSFIRSGAQRERGNFHAKSCETLPDAIGSLRM